MGISGLLPQLRGITRRTNLREHAGQRAAVDAYSLLHKGSYSCAREMVEGIPTNRYVEYCMWRVMQLREAGIEPILVFDGGRLPNKKDEEHSRQRARAEAASCARVLQRAGDAAGAIDAYRRAVDITPWHAKQLADAAASAGMTFVVAPYEADAQMAHMAMTGRVDLVVSEDSDMLAYGCPAVLFKLDRDGFADLVRFDDLHMNAALSFKGWDLAMFRQMCVMSGCDFLPSLPGIGVKRAHAAIRRTRCFAKAVRALRWDGVSVPGDYLIRFERALWTFAHQRVYCPDSGAAVHLTPIPAGGLAASSILPDAANLHDSCIDFLGPAMDDATAKGIAHGHLDPMTKEPYRPPANMMAAPPRTQPQLSWTQPTFSVRASVEPAERAPSPSQLPSEVDQTAALGATHRARSRGLPLPAMARRPSASTGADHPSPRMGLAGRHTLGASTGDHAPRQLGGFGTRGASIGLRSSQSAKKPTRSDPGQPTLLSVLQRGLATSQLRKPVRAGQAVDSPRSSQGTTPPRLSPHFPAQSLKCGTLKVSVSEKTEPHCGETPKASGCPGVSGWQKEVASQPEPPCLPESPEMLAYATPPEPAGCGTSTALRRPSNPPVRRPSFGPVAVCSQGVLRDYTEQAVHVGEEELETHDTPASTAPSPGFYRLGCGREKGSSNGNLEDETLRPLELVDLGPRNKGADDKESVPCPPIRFPENGPRGRDIEGVRGNGTTGSPAGDPAAAESAATRVLDGDSPRQPLGPRNDDNAPAPEPRAVECTNHGGSAQESATRSVMEPKWGSGYDTVSPLANPSPGKGPTLKRPSKENSAFARFKFTRT